MKQFWQKNKVLILGMISAMCVALYEFIAVDITDWWVVGYAAFLGAGSYLSKNLRGQWVSIAGAVLGAGATIYTAHQTGGPVNIAQLLLTMAVNVGLAVAPPPKPVEYEHTPIIQRAKAEAEVIKEEEKTAK